MKLTPLDIRHQEFTAALRGFSRGEVKEFLERAADQLEETERELRATTERVAALEAQVQELREGEELLRRAVVSAERIANELRAGAEREAAAIVQQAESARESITRDAHQRVRQVRADLDRLRGERSLFLDQFRGMLMGYLAAIERAEHEDPAEVTT
ncbi:MAG TPA: DivIVA domain-containing protein [Deinococcales bacterium]|nr:DivIVA domain-containing protein [Deinococcales bacterium]